MSIPAQESVDLFRSAFLAFQEWRRRRAAVKEINGLGRHEAERVLGECGLTAQDFACAMHRDRASTVLLPQALRANRFDPADFAARHIEWNRDLNRTCMLCSQRRHCADALAADRFEASYHDFCPNRDEIDALKKLYGAEDRA